MTVLPDLESKYAEAVKHRSALRFQLEQMRQAGESKQAELRAAESQVEDLRAKLDAQLLSKQTPEVTS